MNRLRQPGDSDYDVLGLLPGASDEEINIAFRQLIDGEGYKVGIPLNRYWLRAHQIKAAHAALADPEKRRAYDESLGHALDPASWAMTANDAATDALILPEIEPEATEPVDNQSTLDPVVRRDRDTCALTGFESERAPVRGLERDVEDAVGSMHEEPPYLAPMLDDNKRVLAGRWAMATTAAFGLGLVLLSSWPGWKSQPSTSDGTPSVAAYAAEVSGTRSGLGQYSAQAPGDFDGPGGSDPEARGMPTAGSPAASDTLDRPLELQSASDARATKDADELALHEDSPPTGTTTAGAGQSSAPVEAPAAPAIAPPSTPPVVVGPAIAAAPAWAGFSGSLVRTPPRWVGGGPTNADNRRGRYQGTVAVQVTVKPNGRVSKCAPVRGSGNAELDAMTCRLVRKRARFTPALDANGRPVVSQTYTSFVWSSRRRN